MHVQQYKQSFFSLSENERKFFFSNLTFFLHVVVVVVVLSLDDDFPSLSVEQVSLSQHLCMEYHLATFQHLDRPDQIPNVGEVQLEVDFVLPFRENGNEICNQIH